VIEGAKRVRLELAADWLVMAAWLTWLKSRLLVPSSGSEDLEDGLLAAEALAERLQDDSRLGQACAAMTTVYSTLGEHDEALVKT